MSTTLNDAETTTHPGRIETEPVTDPELRAQLDQLLVGFMLKYPVHYNPDFWAARRDAGEWTPHTRDSEQYIDVELACRADVERLAASLGREVESHQSITVEDDGSWFVAWHVQVKAYGWVNGQTLLKVQHTDCRRAPKPRKPRAARATR